MGWFPAILIAWSALVVLAYLFELGLYYYDRGLGKWTAILPRLHQVRKKIYVLVWASSLPLLLTCLVHMLSRVSSIRDSQPRLKLDQPSTKGDDEESINADIAGDGVRYAMITQAVVLALAILLGLFHSNRTAVKELGMVILAFLSYLVFNLGYSYSNPIWVERVAVCMQIDALTAALSTTFSDKEALASRWFICCAVCCQGAALSMLGFVASTLSSSEGAFHYRFFWGTEFDNTHSIPSAFWLYFALRVLIELHNSWLALSWTSFFNKAEHDRKDEILDRLNRFERDGNQMEDLNADVSALILHKYYTSRHGTVFTSCTPQLIFSIAPLLGLEVLATQCENVKGISEWGQRAALIPPIVGILHWCYRQAENLYKTQWKFPVSKSIRRVTEADELRADPLMKRLFQSLLRSFIDNDDNGVIRRVMGLSEEMLISSIKGGDLVRAREAIHSGAPLQVKPLDLSKSYISPLFMAAESPANADIFSALLAPMRGDSGSEPIYATPMVLAAKLNMKGLTESATLTSNRHIALLNTVNFWTEGVCSDDQIRILLLLESDSRTANFLSSALYESLKQSKPTKFKQILSQGGPVIVRINKLCPSGTVLDGVQRNRSGPPWPQSDVDDVVRLLRENGAKTGKELILDLMQRKKRV